LLLGGERPLDWLVGAILSHVHQVWLNPAQAREESLDQENQNLAHIIVESFACSHTYFTIQLHTYTSTIFCMQCQPVSEQEL